MKKFKRILAVISFAALALTLTSCTPLYASVAATLNSEGQVEIYVPACGKPLEIDSIRININTTPDIEDTWTPFDVWKSTTYIGDSESAGGAKMGFMDQDKWGNVSLNAGLTNEVLEETDFFVYMEGSETWSTDFNPEYNAMLEKGSYSYGNIHGLNLEEVEEACIEDISHRGLWTF